MSTDTLAEQLIARWIEPNPHAADAAEARVLPHRVLVWVVVAQLELEQGTVPEVSAAFALPREAIAAATAYYQRHRAAIDASPPIAPSSLAKRAWRASSSTPMPIIASARGDSG